ncbi:hypothetical protein AVEN_8103-1 [Araneus ventricosus]|uniref:DUF4371 domain-containing protein n=1 Tax=Araneus ventricosus TaxID=182803 RepID=A0A4Y2MGZ4_ARAVE|nr:hypothetical protein AVEN_8103-1 [Araneus ventricosus]
MESFLSLQKFQEDDSQDWAINCQQRKELLFFRKIHSVARNCPSPVSVEWGGLRRVRAHRVKEDLTKLNYVSVSMDASNRKDIKLVPIVVHYFNPNSGVQIKLLDFKSVAGETSEILTHHLCSVLLQNDLNNKVVGFCGENYNTNFGGVKRSGKNVLHRLKNSLGREINGIGCGAHIVHNCVQTAVDSFPIDIETALVKIYKYFHIYTVRVTKVKEFCEYAEVQYCKLIQHGNTRFL